MEDIANRAVAEAHALHDFFVAWFRAGTEIVPDFARMEAALGADFRMVTPDGALQDRSAVLERVRGARGKLPDDFSILVREPRTVWRAEGAVLLEFIEEQYRAGATTSRRSTALFTDQPGAPNDLLWRHLQETWIRSG